MSVAAASRDANPTPSSMVSDDPGAAAALEKSFAAERDITWVRNGVIALNIFVYWVLMDRAGTHEALALVISVVAAAYAVLYTAFQPFRGFPAMLGAPFTSVTEATLITGWLYATGGFESPFYVLWYVSLAAIAFRFDLRITALISAVYALLYLGLLGVRGELTGNWDDLLVRIGYIFFVGILGGLLSRETVAQTQAKIEMQNLALSASRAKRDLENTVSLLNATLDSTADGILVVDEQGRIASFNKKFVQMWRLPADILEARDDTRAINFVLDQLKDPQGFVRKVQELYATPDAESFDTLEFKDGRVFERYSQPQRREGRSIGRVWSFRDVTQQRRAEADNLRHLERAKEIERLRELDDFKTRFVNSVAHELWTPLTPIKLQLHILRKEGRDRLTKEDERSLEIINRNMDRLQHLVEEMLDGARLQAGRFRVVLQPTDLAPIVREVTDLFEPAARDARLRFTVDVDPSIGVEADRNRLTQVLYNLLSNAFKFTPPGGRIHVHARAEEGRALVSIQDTGAGMSAAQIGKLFQPFSQAHDTMQQTHAGTGLGLYISKAVVDAHHGEITCHSEGPGKGSVFEFWIPARPAGPSPIPSARQESTG